MAKVETVETKTKQATVEETPFEALASVCSVFVIGLFLFTFLVQNFVIPSGSMEKTLLVGDHVAVDRITLAPPASWMPLVRYREPQRGDIIVFLKPGEQDMFLVKRLVGVPGDHIHLRNGVVILNGQAQNEPKVQKVTREDYSAYIDEFPSVSADTNPEVTERWAVDLPQHIEGNDLVVPPGHYFMMGDNRQKSLDSRFWGFVPRENIIGKPLFVYWSFNTGDEQMYKTSIGDNIAWMGHVALHFFTETRWSRMLRSVN